MHMKKPLLLVITLIALILSACGTVKVGIATPTLTGSAVESLPPTMETPAVPPTSTPTPQPDVPSTLTPTESTPPETDSTPYWTVHQDPVLGFRFAVPCFWRVEFPAEGGYDLQGGTLYHAFNFPQDYAFSFPRMQIPPENGAFGAEFDIININSYDLPPGSSLREFVIQENSGGESEIISMEDEVINGQPALSIIIQYPNSAGRYYLIKLSDEHFIRFSAQPSHKLLDTPDFKGMLNSITVDPSAEVLLPTHTPAPPPLGVAAPCIPEFAVAVVPEIEIPPENTACGVDSYKSLDFLTQAVQQDLQDRNTGGLRWDYRIHDPFMIDYWGSGGGIKTPDEVATELANSLYNPAQPGGMTFTADPGEFPPFVEGSPEDLMHPGVNLVHVIYSQGWGMDGQGAALLYFVQDECDGFYWYGLTFSESNFE
jgi:hypothetical protein